MGTYREENLRAKNIRRGGIDQRERPVGGKKVKKPRQIVVEYRYAEKTNRWRKWKRYVDVETAKRMIAKEHRSMPGYYEFRIVGEK